MGIIFGDQKVVDQPADEVVRDEAVTEPVSEEQQPGGDAVPSDALALSDEPKKPSRRNRKRR